MGDRALIVFDEGKPDALVTVAYSHWGGSQVLDLLKGAAPRMRKGDASYALARFIGHCHQSAQGNTGLGVWAAQGRAEGQTWEQWANDISHGDAGVFVVGEDSGEVRQYSGYKPKGHEDKDHGDLLVTLDMPQ